MELPRVSIATQTIILIGVGLYLILMLAVGLLAARKSHSLADFIVAGRNMSLGICSVSIAASWFGGGPMMGSAAAAYSGNRLEVIADPIAAGVGLILVGAFFARTFRRSGRLTWIEFFEVRFGKVAGVIGALGDLVGITIWLGAMLFTFGIVFESLTGAPAALGIIGGAAIIVLYTVVGGLWAVAMTDLLQSILIVVGLVVLFVVVLDEVGGWSELTLQLPAHAFQFLPATGSPREWLDHIHIWLGYGAAGALSTVIIQRAMAARNERVAQNAFYYAGIGYLLIGMIPVMLGYMATVVMPGVEDPNAIIPLLAIEYLHPVAVAIFVGAVISAIMSTSDSVLLGCGAIVSTNLLPLVHESPSEQLRLRVARWSIPVFAIIAIFFAFNAESIISAILDSIAYLLAGLIAPFVLCVWWQKTNRSGALAGMFSGLGTWAFCSIVYPELPGDLIGFGVSLPTTVIVSLLTQRFDPPRMLSDAEGNPIVLTDRLGVLRVV